MRATLRLIILICLGCSFSSAQTPLNGTVTDKGQVQTGFVVITPVSGTGEGLIVSENFGSRVGENFFQSSVLATPLVTNTAIVVTSDTLVGRNTGLAIVNPNDVQAMINFALHNDQGVTIATRTIMLGARQQLSRFVNESFGNQPGFSGNVTGLLFISSNVPIGILGLRFRGAAFTSLPPVRQIGITSLTPAPLTSLSTTTPNPPGVSRLTVTAFPATGASVIGTGSVILPQFAIGGGWLTEITIANPTPVAQTVRVDFFTSTGAPLSTPGLNSGASSLPSVLIPAGGLVILAPGSATNGLSMF